MTECWGSNLRKHEARSETQVLECSSSFPGKSKMQAGTLR